MDSSSTSVVPQAGETSRLHRPELLAPAGDWECARAAVENGADAIYFGLERFNARMRANNFTEADLAPLMEFLHRRGVKGYVTFNTLVFENELAAAETYLRVLIASGVDAAIVQDVGICRMIRRLSPDFPIHVSTQMTVTSAAGVAFARELGCNLVVLARECSLKEMEQIISLEKKFLSDGHSESGDRSGMPLEVFVHGALCVAYSGQCLTSEALGGRSANRGECAQACRLPYDLLSDGQRVDLGDRKYLLSPQDLAGLELIGDLARVGIASLKIEGRLKAPEYVATITRIYRQALDRLVPEPAGAQQAAKTEPGRDDRYEMEMAFSRGLFTGWMRGVNNQALVHAHFGKKRGVYLGQVEEVRRDGVCLRLEGPLKAGDGVVFDAGKPEQKEEGGRVYEVCEEGRANGKTKSALVKLTFGRDALDLNRIHPGEKVWKTSDPDLERRLRTSFASEVPRFQRPLWFVAHGHAGVPLTLFARDELGHIARADSAMALVAAENHGLTKELLSKQLGRLGGTPFRLESLETKLEGELMLPPSELNRLRRSLVEELLGLRAKPPRWKLESKPVDFRCKAPDAPAPGAEAACELVVLVRNLGQLDAAVESGVRTIYCEFEDPRKYREAVARFRSQPERASGSEIFVAPPRIFKMGEEWTLKQVRSSEADGYLVRNYDHLAFFHGERCVGDYSLNIANHLSADYFKNQFGLERVTASYDLNFEQLEALLAGAPPAWFEITIHQHIPMFHMEHCVFCAFLSQGTDYTNCGRPCDRHDLKLRDRVGAEHPVKADAGCRNTVFNSRAQTGAEHVARLLALGARWLRLEFLNESPETASRTIARYRQLIRGEITGAQLWRELKLLNQLGVTRGQLAGGKG